MATVTAAEFKTLINKASLAAATAEIIIDQAINWLNRFGAELSNLGGTEGSKTLSVESKQKGAIYEAARAVYHGFYANPQSASIGALGLTPADLMSNPQVLQAIKEAAREITEMDVSRG